MDTKPLFGNRVTVFETRVADVADRPVGCKGKRSGHAVGSEPALLNTQPQMLTLTFGCDGDVLTYDKIFRTKA